MLVMVPPEELRTRIIQLRRDLCTKLQVPFQSGWRPQLILLRFSQLEMMEERMVNRLRTVCMGFRPFRAELKDFGSIPSHSLYLQVSSREPFRQLVRELRPLQRLLKMDPARKPYFMEEPFLTLASKLKPWQYEKAIAEFGQRHFSGRFIADSLLLLKKPAGENRYQILQRFEFENLPVATRQGELFI